MSQKMSDYVVPCTINIRRVRANTIEYDVTAHDPLSGDETRTYHANREATFFGPHTGNPARQINGGASSLWRADDFEMLRAFKRAHSNVRNISIDQ